MSSPLAFKHAAPLSKCLRIGVIATGAPAGGMNAALASLVKYAHHRGHVIVGLFGGWDVVLDGAATLDNHDSSIAPRVLTLSDVDGLVGRGGIELGLDRSWPDTDAKIDKARLLVDRLKLDALVLIGGYEAFLAARSLANGLPSLPTILIPCTISNNVPGTDYTVGADTALNVIVSACDAIRLSAASTKRVFVVEVQGGYCGFLAAFGGLAAGATRAYLPEEGISLSDVQRDLSHLCARFRDDRKQGRLLLLNEKASDCYTAEVMAKILALEAKGLFDAKTVKLGHLQQGGAPSPRDRILAARFAIKTIDALEGVVVGAAADSSATGPASSPRHAIIGILGTCIQLTDLATAVQSADDKLRRVVQPWWFSFRAIPRLLAKYPVSRQDLEAALADHDDRGRCGA